MNNYFATTRVETVNLFPEEKPLVTLTSYIAGCSEELPFNQKRKAFLVIPGGAYWACSDREAEPIAHYLLAAGYNTFILNYSTQKKGGQKWPSPLVDASAAMKYIRDHAEEFRIDPDYVFVVGFSAGGHLAAALGTMWDNDEIEKQLGFEKGYNRPTGMLLSYPVLSGLEYAHRGSFDNILWEDRENEEMRRALSIEFAVSEKTCPAYIWHCMDDGSVPVQNSVLLAKELADKKIPFELHIYQHGGHGSSLGTPVVGRNMPYLRSWIDEGIAFLETIKAEKDK